MSLLDRPGALVVLVGVLVIVFLMWRLARQAPGKPTPAAAAPAAAGEPAHESLLLRFVQDESGQRVGETVAIDGDRVVVKTPAGFVEVPAAKLQAKGDAVRLESGVDWDEARRLGDAWRERSHKVISYSETELPKDES